MVLTASPGDMLAMTFGLAASSSGVSPEFRGPGSRNPKQMFL